MLNRICIMGRITRDLELRRTQDGTAVTSFTVAVDDDFKSKATGEKKTYFLDVVAWRQSAEFVCQYFGKGRMVVVEGKLTVRDWKDKDGNNRRNAEIISDNIYFGDSKRNDATEPHFTVESAAGNFAVISEDDGDLPMVVVEGKLTVRDWTDKDGNKRRNAEIIADNIYFGDSKRNDTAAPQYAAESAVGGFAEVSEDDGELPF